MVSERIQRRIERLLDRIEEAADDRDWTTVEDLSAEVLHLDAENDDAKTFLDLAKVRTSGDKTASGPEP